VDGHFGFYLYGAYDNPEFEALRIASNPLSQSDQHNACYPIVMFQTFPEKKLQFLIIGQILLPFLLFGSLEAPSTFQN
jgi:hypothetical protein